MKKLISLALVLVLALGLVTVSAESQKVRILASPNPHEILLQYVKDDLKELGYDLEITWMDGWVLQNPSTSNKEFDANFFQHIPYLNDYNSTVGEEDQLVAVIPVHYEPFGIYAGTKKSIEDLVDGDSVAVPNDPTNETRALLLLQDAGLVTLPEGSDYTSSLSKLDVKPGKVNLEIVEVDAERLPATLEDVAVAVINGNYAIGAGFYPTRDSLLLESTESDSAEVYTNYVVVRADRVDEPFVEALRKVLHTQKVYDFLQNNDDFKGGVVPFFEVTAEE